MQDKIQTDQPQWQSQERKISDVQFPSNVTSAESIATAGSTAYMTKDAEQMLNNKTGSNTHVTLAQACASQDMDMDDDNPDQA
jgi:hypothetical protein